ncbi:MAG: DUF1049 domain-containing protein [Oceanicaulis sp.]|nr:DUF1049 domain-containing protein [Oceanicaulis sp.]
MKITIKLLATLLLAIVIIFAVQNMALVEVRFMVWSFETNRVLVIVGPFILGALFGPMVYRAFKRR